MESGSTKKNKKILILDDEEDITSLFKGILENNGYSVVAKNTVEEANEEIKKSLKNGHFHLAIIDVKMGPRSGIDFAKRLTDLGLNTGIIHITGHPDDLFGLTYEPDDIIIKPFKVQMLLDIVNSVLEKKDRKTEREIRINQWMFAQDLKGLNAIKFFSHRIIENQNENVEKITGKCTKDNILVPFVNYKYPNQDIEKIVIAISSLAGCLGKCKFCINWLSRGAPFLRILTFFEIICQVYITLMSNRLREVFTNDYKGSITVNATCEGDGLVYNLDNLCLAFKSLANIVKPELDFIITSIGNEKSLRSFIDKYIDIPRLTHYWSVNSLDENFRAWLMPGTKNQSLERTRDLYQEIAEKTGKEITASWILIKNLTDREEDAEALNKFFTGRPFKLKIMSLVPGSMKNTEDVSEDDVERFMSWIDLPKRYRDIYGKYEYAGCGNTLPEGLPYTKK